MAFVGLRVKQSMPPSMVWLTVFERILTEFYHRRQKSLLLTKVFKKHHIIAKLLGKIFMAYYRPAKNMIP